MGEISSQSRSLFKGGKKCLHVGTVLFVGSVFVGTEILFACRVGLFGTGVGEGVGGVVVGEGVGGTVGTGVGAGVGGVVVGEGVGGTGTGVGAGVGGAVVGEQSPENSVTSSEP